MRLNDYRREWRLALAVGVVASLATSLAFFLAMSPVAQKPGTVSFLIRLVAKPGFLGYVAGMFVAGNAHAGGPLPLVLTVATLVNFSLYTTIGYGIVRLFRGEKGQTGSLSE